MILAPAIIALLLGSFLTAAMLLAAALQGIAVLRNWDLASGSETQLRMERRTYLISTLVSWSLLFQLFSLFFFMYTADDLCRLFSGAMCAAGTLQADAHGYPALLLKIANFLLAGTWLVMNHADTRAWDYPLIGKKYALLLLIAPLAVTEAVVQLRFFLGLSPDIITSCCGTLFSPESRSFAARFAELPAGPVLAVFYVLLGLTLSAGTFVFRGSGQGAPLLAALNGLLLPVSLAAVIAVFSLYIYELPTHHCPFCLLKEEHNHIGYPLYLSILAGGTAGIGAGILHPFRGIASLSSVLPGLQRRLALASIIGNGLFGAIVTVSMAVSNLRLEGQ